MGLGCNAASRFHRKKQKARTTSVTGKKLLEFIGDDERIDKEVKGILCTVGRIVLDTGCGL